MKGQKDFQGRQVLPPSPRCLAISPPASHNQDIMKSCSALESVFSGVVLGELKRTGIVIPTTEDIYVPILKKLKEDGIEPKNHSILM